MEDIHDFLLLCLMSVDLHDNNQNNNSIVVKNTPDIATTKPVEKSNSAIISGPIDVESSESLVLLDIAALKQRLRQTENKMCSIIAVMSETEKQVRNRRSLNSIARVWHMTL